MDLILDDYGILTIVSLLFICMVTSIEIGYRFGKSMAAKTTKEMQANINSFSAAMLTMLSLLLGFTFSQSLERHDSRSKAVVEEANAIGTALLRLDLIPEPTRASLKQTMQEYIDLRIEAAQFPLRSPEDMSAVDRASKKQQELWQDTMQATQDRHDPATVSLVSALNNMFDSFSTRYAELSRIVPESVVLMLMIAILLTGAILGFASGTGSRRPSIVAYELSVLIVSTVFLVIDLDRPRSGFIKVPQGNLISLQASICENGQ